MTDARTATESPARVATEWPRHLVALLERLTVAEKAALVSGGDFWTTTPIERIGLRAIVLSDGPAGVRGEEWDERKPSVNLPSGTALAASWDPEIAYRYGAVAAHEATAKGVHVVLGPTINLHRSPRGGRHFEAFSEDPLLTGRLAAAYVHGLQDNGVAASPKHYVANDSETDRLTVDVRVDERALHEVYLSPFEAAVDAGAWTVMSAYNSVNGTTMTENDLLTDPLRTEWDFDGVVVSDWTAVRDLRAARADQDLAMPGPAAVWGDALAAAVDAGEIDEALLDEKVLRILRLAERVGALDGTAIVRGAAEDGIAFTREAAVEGAVLVRNAGELPWDAAGIGRIAVIGHNASAVRTQGGGSATVVPERVVSPLEAIAAALPGAEVHHELGAIVQHGVAALSPDALTNPRTGGRGVAITFRDASGAVIGEEDRFSTRLVWFGGDAPITRAATLELRTLYTPTTTESVDLGFATSKRGRVTVDGVVVLDGIADNSDTSLGAAFLAPRSLTTPLELVAGAAREIVAAFDLGSTRDALTGALSVTLGTEPRDIDADALIARAAEAAARADVAVVVVGTNAEVESEGFDRTELSLPGRQDDLVRAVARANPRTVVVVNAGAPVLLPWRDEVAAVLLSWFGGQEAGAAIADVLLGVVEPGGRLPTTWPASLEDVPVLDVTPVDGVLAYRESIGIGHRAWAEAAAEPAFAFGSGRGYTTWRLGEPRLEGDIAGGDAAIRLTVQNTGDRPGKEVVQVYASWPSSAIERPGRALVGWAVVRAAAGAASEVTVPIPTRPFAHRADGGWELEPGPVILHVGTSVQDIAAELPAEIGIGGSAAPSVEADRVARAHRAWRAVIEQAQAGWTAEYAPARESYAPELWDVASRAIEIPGRHGAIPARVYEPLGESTGATFLWIHGGAFALGDLEMPEADWVARVVAAAGHRVVSADYQKSLGGVHYPLPTDDVIDAWTWTVETADGMPGGVHLGGGSAGAALAASATTRIRDEGLPLPDSLFLAYPVVHPRIPPRTEEQERAYLTIPDLTTFPAEILEGMHRGYAGSLRTMRDPHAFAGLSAPTGFPPTFVLNSDRDILRSSGDLFARQLDAAGVEVRRIVETGTLHGHLNDPADPGGRRSVARLVEWLDERARAARKEGAPR
ncbi:glycoside hydrolase family 3 C-terminal domain-containing protein [Microbacterium sp. X-17]|uniref:glycoside hydrolase family 3 C-terminal domain-containing protein n=1 Tax=Microbacterium sp. X-17 TaxID=3144404 RepID=UPI0031F5980D